MVVGIITGRGTVPLIRVPSKVKINAEYYVDYVLKPLFAEHLPRLYRNDINKVFFYHEKAPSHTSKVTMATYKRLSKSLGFLLSITRIYLSKLQMVVRLIFLALVFLKKSLQSEEPKHWMVFGKCEMRYGQQLINLGSKEFSIAGKGD